MLGSRLCSAIVVLREFGMVTVLQLLIWKMGVVRINVLKVLKCTACCRDEAPEQASSFSRLETIKTH